MSNKSFGNLLYFDTNGAINQSHQTKISKISLWWIDNTSELTLTVNGTTALRLAPVFNGTGTTVVNPIETSFCGNGWYIENASIATVTAGSGYIYTV